VSKKGSGKVRRTERYRYLVADPSQAREDLSEARLAERRAQGTEAHADAQQRLRDAERAVEDCYGTIVLRALSPTVHETFEQELVERDQVHAAAVEAAKEAGQDLPPQPDRSWKADSLEVRLLAACDVDDGHTALWWAAEFDGDEWTHPERDELLELCYTVNTSRRLFDLGVLGKG
jgi:hypothetical protein